MKIDTNFELLLSIGTGITVKTKTKTTSNQPFGSRQLGRFIWLLVLSDSKCIRDFL